jgi:hypothetical protein
MLAVGEARFLQIEVALDPAPHLSRWATSGRCEHRHCERSEAIQTASAVTVWIASAVCASQ